MKAILLATAATGALLLAGCAAVQTLVGSTGDANLIVVANKIDAGAQLAAADLPSACQIVGQIATLASAYAASGLSSGGAATTVAKTANSAAALAGSAICQNPASADPVAASVQIIGAAAAVKAATAGSVSAPTAATSLPSGG